MHPTPFDLTDDRYTFRGLPVARRTVKLVTGEFELWALPDAADLLDDEKFAERFEKHDIAPYGMELWPSAVMLARVVESWESPTPLRCLELGCGLGLVSMAARRKAWTVTATDHDEAALEFARFNAAANGCDGITFSQLDWANPTLRDKFDLVLAADVTYELRNHVPLLDCCRRFLAADGTAMICDPCRSVADHFHERAAEHGFDVAVENCEALGNDGRSVKGRIFRLNLASDSPDGLA